MRLHLEALPHFTAACGGRTAVVVGVVLTCAHEYKRVRFSESACMYATTLYTVSFILTCYHIAVILFIIHIEARVNSSCGNIRISKWVYTVADSRLLVQFPRPIRLACSSDKATCDCIHIYDGPTIASPLLKSYCRNYERKYYRITT